MQGSPGVSTLLIGERYLRTLPLERRRAGGQVYTPSYLADFVLQHAGFGIKIGGSLLDPACGAGVFLERAVAVLAKKLHASSPTVSKAAGRRALADAVESSLFGVDVDETACEMTRDAVLRAVNEHTGRRLPAGFFRDNVVRADFLFSDDVAGLLPSTEQFRLIVGNPPYVPTTRIDLQYKARLRRSFEVAAGRLDLYAIFMERSLSLLAPGGRLALLTPDKFLVSQSARELRSLLLRHNAIRTIARFRSHRVFADAATVPCVTIIERAGKSGDVTVLSCGESPDALGHVPILEKRTIKQSTLSSGPWHLHALDHHEMALKLQYSHPRLADVTTRISAGPATGRDKIFVFPSGSQPEIEECLLRSVVRGRDLGKYCINDPHLDALIPYTFDEAGTSSLIDISSFPGARRYLQRHRAELETRHCVRVWGKRWYDLHDQVIVDLAQQPKILVPDVANSNRFVVDRGQFLPLHSVYYLIPRDRMDLDYLCAILNSRVAEFLVKVFSPVIKDGFNRYRQQFLTNIPVPAASVKQAREISVAVRDGRSDDVDLLVAQLFGLSLEQYQELSVVDSMSGVRR